MISHVHGPPQKWLRSTNSSPPTGSQQRQSGEDQGGDPHCGGFWLPASQESGRYAPAPSEDVDDLDKLAALLELSGLGVGESTLEDILREGRHCGERWGFRERYHL